MQVEFFEPVGNGTFERVWCFDFVSETHQNMARMCVMTTRYLARKSFPMKIRFSAGFMEDVIVMDIDKPGDFTQRINEMLFGEERLCVQLGSLEQKQPSCGL